MRKRISGGEVQRQSYGQDVVGRWRESGESVRAFCRAEGLRESTFYFWRRELARRGHRVDRQPGIRSPGATFVPVKLVRDDPGGARQAARRRARLAGTLPKRVEACRARRASPPDCHAAAGAVAAVTGRLPRLAKSRSAQGVAQESGPRSHGVHPLELDGAVRLHRRRLAGPRQQRRQPRRRCESCLRRVGSPLASDQGWRGTIQACRSPRATRRGRTGFPPRVTVGSPSPPSILSSSAFSSPPSRAWESDSQNTSILRPC